MIALVISGVVPVTFWLGGYNFDTRGEGAVFCFFLTLVAFILAIPMVNEFRENK